jgi:hypothetical protein
MAKSFIHPQRAGQIKVPFSAEQLFVSQPVPFLLSQQANETLTETSRPAVPYELACGLHRAGAESGVDLSYPSALVIASLSSVGCRRCLGGRVLFRHGRAPVQNDLP